MQTCWRINVCFCKNMNIHIFLSFCTYQLPILQRVRHTHIYKEWYYPYFMKIVHSDSTHAYSFIHCSFFTAHARVVYLNFRPIFEWCWHAVNRMVLACSISTTVDRTGCLNYLVLFNSYWTDQLTIQPVRQGKNR